MDEGTVQAIAATLNFEDTVPPEFVRTEDEQPGATTYRGDAPPAVPIVDFAAQHGARAVDAIAAAAREWGVFQLVNHGIPDEAVAELQRVGTEFFELPPAEKEVRLSDPKTGSIEGYGTQIAKDVNGKKAWGDYLFHIVWPPSRVNHDYWPRKPSSYREANEQYSKHLVGVVDKILESLSLGLGLHKGAVKEAMGGDDMLLLLKINYYPPCPRPDLVLGVVTHTDMSAITVLVPNDVPGLQIFREDIGWFTIDYAPGALIVHIGDQIQIASNGWYKSVLHRVTVNKERTRITWPVFCEPPPEQVVGPLPQLVTEEKPAKYKTKTYKDYRNRKLNKLPQ